jgi:hypothetical protein
MGGFIGSDDAKHKWLEP